MAILPPGTIVDLTESAAEVLCFAAPDGDLTVVVHPSALRARFDAHTRVARFGDDGLARLGALSEHMLVAHGEEHDRLEPRHLPRARRRLRPRGRGAGRRR